MSEVIVCTATDKVVVDEHTFYGRTCYIIRHTMHDPMHSSYTWDRLNAYMQVFPWDRYYGMHYDKIRGLYPTHSEADIPLHPHANEKLQLKVLQRKPWWIGWDRTLRDSLQQGEVTDKYLQDAKNYYLKVLESAAHKFDNIGY